MSTRAASQRTSAAGAWIRRIAASSLWLTAALVIGDLARIPHVMQEPGGSFPRPADAILAGVLIYGPASIAVALAAAAAAEILARRAKAAERGPRSTAPFHAGAAVIALLVALSVAALAERAPGGRWVSASGLLALMAAGFGAAGAAWLAARLVRRASSGPNRSIRIAALVSSPLVLVAILAASNLLQVRGGTAPAPPAPTPSDLPDVLLLVAESFRADALSCCGGEGLTPSLDSLGARGVTLTEGVATAPAAAASTAGLLTSLLPSQLGELWSQERLPEETHTLAAAFRSRGYSTAAIVSSSTVSAARGMHRGFEHWDEAWDTRFEARHPTSLAARLLRAFGRETRRDPPRAAEIVDRALEWMVRSSERPRFLYLNFSDTQAPYDPPEDVRGALGGWPSDEGAFGKESLDAALRGRVTLDEPAIRRAKAYYAAEAAYLDREIGRLVEGVGDRLASGRLLVSFTSSHGEELLDHGSLGNGHTLHAELVRVPVIVARPGILPAGRKVAEPLSLVDLGPTLLDLAGLPAEGAFTGSSRAALLAGGDAPLQQAAPSICEMDAVGFHTTAHWSRSARQGRWKVILTSTDVLGVNPWRLEVYDLASDPGEAVNRAGQVQDTALLEAWLREWIDRHPPTPGAAGSEAIALARSRNP